jgi:hypothetical protein
MEDYSYGKDVLLLRSRMPESIRSEPPQIHEDVTTSSPFFYEGINSKQTNRKSARVYERKSLSIMLETCKK